MNKDAKYTGEGCDQCTGNKGCVKFKDTDQDYTSVSWRLHKV